MALLRPSLTWTIPVAAWVLSLACPTVPQFIWFDILTAVNNGDIITADLKAFMAAKGIKTYASPEDFPPQKQSGAFNDPTMPAQSNINP